MPWPGWKASAGPGSRHKKSATLQCLLLLKKQIIKKEWRGMHSISRRFFCLFACGYCRLPCSYLMCKIKLAHEVVVNIYLLGAVAVGLVGSMDNDFIH